MYFIIITEIHTIILSDINRYLTKNYFNGVNNDIHKLFVAYKKVSTTKILLTQSMTERITIVRFSAFFKSHESFVYCPSLIKELHID